MLDVAKLRNLIIQEDFVNQISIKAKLNSSITATMKNVPPTASFSFRTLHLNKLSTIDVCNAC